MQECRHTVWQKQGKMSVFKCELYHIDIGKSCFKTFPPRRAVKYAALLIQTQISPSACNEGV